MIDFKKYKLGDLGEIRMCKRILKEETNTKAGIPFYKISTFGNKADVFIDREKFLEYKEKYSYPKKGDILISAAGTIGRTVVFNGEESYFQDSNIVWIENDESKVLNEYLFYCYKNIKWYTSTGSTILRLYNDNIRNSEIIAPDISTQKKIADVLSCIDDKIALNNKANTELENMAKTIYDYWFTQFDFPDKNGYPYKTSGGQMVYNETLKREIPAGWEVGKLSDIAEVFNGSTPSTKEDDNYGGNIVWITPKDLSDQQKKFTWYGERNITEKGYKDCNTTLVPKGTILLSSRAPIGLVSIAACELCTNQGFKNIVPKNLIFQNYDYYVIKTNIPKIEQLGSGTTFKEVSKQSMESFKVIIPPLDIIEKYNHKVCSIFDEQLKLLKENDELTKVRDYLLPLLMNGQIEVK